MIVFFVYNILIFNYKDTKNYRDYQLFKRISYPELRYEGIIVLSGGVGSEVYSHKADKARDRAADYTQKANAMLSK